jgi:hypothetical protein
MLTANDFFYTITFTTLMIIDYFSAFGNLPQIYFPVLQLL